MNYSKSRKYTVQITETLCTTVTVKAESRRDAEDIVRNMYKTCEIILDASNLVDTEFEAEENISFSTAAQHMK